MIATLLYSISGGMMIILTTGKPQEIAWRFIRLVGLIVVALAFGTTFWHMRRTEDMTAPLQAISIIAGYACAASGMSLALLAPWTSRQRKMFIAITVVGGLFGITAAACHTLINTAATSDSHIAESVGLVISQVFAAMLLGSITITWLLGHAYLTATNMTIDPLRHFSRTLNWAVIGRIGFLMISLLTAFIINPQIADTDGAFSMALMDKLTGAWLILTLRAGVGLIAVAVFAYMITDCVRLRATQSATGILYFGSLFAYVGELASQHLILETGWPV